jgi:AcrR family transcriptional regulator
VSQSDAPRAGRPQLVSSDEILAQARRMVSAVGVDDFSVRELAKSLGLVPGTIHARFGNRDELLAQLYIQRLHSCRLIIEAARPADVLDYLEVLSQHLPALRREFILHFERDRVTGPNLSVETWSALKAAFTQLSSVVYQRFSEAAAAESVAVLSGPAAQRLVWTVASALDWVRYEDAFSYREDEYRRFVAHTLLTSLAQPASA